MPAPSRHRTRFLPWTSLAWFAGILSMGTPAMTAADSPLDYRVEPWRAPGVASDQWESHPALDPRTGDLWFTRSDKSFSGWHLMMSRRTADGWAKAIPAPITAPGLEADPWFAPDGATVWFISTRASATLASTDLDIWTAERDGAGHWSPPQRLPEPVNSDAAEWYPRPAPDGWLYFGSRRAGGLGKDDIWRARRQADGRWHAENAGPAINSAGAEYEFLPSPDGTWALLATDQGFFRVARGPHGWEPRQRLGPAVNANGSETGPMFLPDGRSFLFSRDAGGGRSGELFLAYRGERPDWRRQFDRLVETGRRGRSGPAPSTGAR
jgi:hypothetical protein